MRLVILVKTYRLDAPLVRRLLESLERYNVELLPVVLSVPDDDVRFFTQMVGRQAEVVPDSATKIPRAPDKLHDFGPGYISQQMVKLSVHRLGMADNYLVLDSDTYFIRELRLDDFVDASGRGLSVLVEDRLQLAEPGYRHFADVRRRKIDAIADVFALPAHSRATCHNNTVLQTDVLEDLERWRESEGLSLLDLMAISPVEFSWYNFFMRKHRPDAVLPVEPFTRMIHTRSEFRSLIAQAYTTDALRRSYLGVCINSGWAGRRQGPLVARLDRGSALARARIVLDERRYALHQRVDWYLTADESPLKGLARLRPPLP